MNNSLRNLSWRDLGRHLLRTLLTIASVAAGVAAVTSIQLSSTSAKQKFRDLEVSIVGRADLEVAVEDGSLFPQSYADKVAHDPDVEHAVPELRRMTRIYHKEDGETKKIEIHAVGVPNILASTEQWNLVDGHFWSAAPDAKEVLLESGLARALKASVNERVTFATLKGPKSYTVAGIVEIQNAQGMARGDAAFFLLEELQYISRADGEIDSVRLVLNEKAPVEEVQQRLATLVPPEVIVRRPEGYTSFAQETIRSVNLGLLFAQALSVILGGCTILNTFLISVGERRKQWSILRAIGATRWQVNRMILFEGLTLGAIGSAVGITAGIWGAKFLTQAVSNVLLLPPGKPVPVDWASIAFLAVLGPVISIVSSALPAWQASKVSPLEGMRGTNNAKNESFPLMAALVALVIWALSTAAIGASLAGYLPPAASILAGVTMMLGFVFCVPPLLPFISQFLTTILRFGWRTESELAVRQTCRNQIRTSLTVAVLIVSIANGIGMGHSLLNNVEDVRSWYQRAMLGDVILRPAVSPLAFGWQDATTEKTLEALANGTTVESMRFATVLANQHSATLIARRLPNNVQLPWDTGDMPPEEVRQRVKAGEAVISSVLAQRLGVKVGDKVQLQLSGRTAEFPIACLVNDYVSGGLTVCLDRDTALKQLGLDGVDTYLLTWPTGKATQAMAELEPFARSVDLLIHSQEALRASLDGMMLGVQAAFWVVLVLGMVVASFATFNTLTMNVLEQTREIGLLRIVGMSRRQVWKTIMSQALIIGLLAAVLGLVAGVTSAYLMHLCSGPLLGRNVDFIWHPVLIVACLIASLVLGWLAAWIPARRASQLPVLNAVQED